MKPRMISSKVPLVQEGRIFVHVNDLHAALRFYRDILGIPTEPSTDEWVDLLPRLGISLSRGDESRIEFHMADFQEAALHLEKAGLK